MPYYYAKFIKDKEVVKRVDTRIYFDKEKPSLLNDHCLGLVILKNPGSAKATRYNKLAKIDLGGDKALPSIANMYLSALDELNVRIRPKGYIRVCNLITLCEPDISKAIKSLETTEYSIEKINYKSLPFVFYAWGWEVELNCYRELYLKKLSKYNTTSFFVRYDFKAKKRFEIVHGQPKLCNKVKHTQGMPQDIVVMKMKELLGKS